MKDMQSYYDTQQVMATFEQYDKDNEIRSKILTNYYSEKDLRTKYPSLQNAWEQYQSVLQLVHNTEFNDNDS